VSVGPGEQKEIVFRLLEERRAVQIIDSDVSVVATPSLPGDGGTASAPPTQ